MEAYLLGTCEPELAHRIDERLFSEDAFYEELQEVKASLITKELAGTLPVLQREQLSLQRSRSPLLEMEVQRARESQPQTTFPSARRPATEASSRRMFRIFGLVTACLLVAIGVRFILQTTHPKAHQSQPTLAANLAPLTPSPHPEAVTANATISIFLPASVLRGENSIPVLHVRDATRPLELQMEIRGQGDTDSIWSVVLYRGPQRILNLPAVSEKTIEGLRYVSIPLPAGTLASGVYQLLLTPGGIANDLAHKVRITRSFRVG